MNKNKVYQIFLKGKKIGFSYLEKADAPMGVAFGKLELTDKSVNRQYLVDYCKNRNILITEFPEDEFLQTCESINELRVYNSEDIEICGVGNQLSVFKDEYEISIQGISYPFYEEEFPHHVRTYAKSFDD